MPTSIEHVAAGGNLSYLLTDSGILFGLGEGGSSPPGAPASEGGSPTALEGAAMWTAVSVGARHVLGLDVQGRVWSWGEGHYGQLGRDPTSPLPGLIELPGRAKVVVAGGYHSLVVLEDGAVFGFGLNDGLQVGVAQPEQVNAPTLLTLPGPALTLAAGAFHTLAVVKPEGMAAELWSWGRNDSGQLGAQVEGEVSMPAVCGLSVTPASIAAGAAHSLMLDTEGGLWSWGGNSRGQLGRPQTGPINTPAQVSMSGEVVGMAAGPLASYAWDTQGLVRSFGAGSFGALGLGTLGSTNEPTLIEGLGGIVQISAGRHHALALDTQGRAWAWGLTQFSQAGPRQRRHPSLSAGLVETPQLLATP